MIWAVSLSTTKLIPRSLTATLHLMAFGVWLTSVTHRAHRPSSSSTSTRDHATLHLNAFRGEPAITEFDWPFTPTHSSSPRFSTLVGSVLHKVLPLLQPGHGYITPLRVQNTRHTPYFRLAFATHTPHGLSTPRITNSQAHSSKGTPSPHKALTAYRHTVSGTISLPSRGTFHHSLTVLCTIGHQVVFRLTKWSWQIHTRFHESRTTRAPYPHHTTPVHLRDSHALRSAIPNCSTPSIMQCDPPAEGSNMAPQHQTRNGRRLSHASGLASSAFARHYSRNIFSCGY